MLNSTGVGVSVSWLRLLGSKIRSWQIGPGNVKMSFEPNSHVQFV